MKQRTETISTPTTSKAASGAGGPITPQTNPRRTDGVHTHCPRTIRGQIGPSAVSVQRSGLPLIASRSPFEVRAGQGQDSNSPQASNRSYPRPPRSATGEGRDKAGAEPRLEGGFVCSSPPEDSAVPWLRGIFRTIHRFPAAFTASYSTGSVRRAKLPRAWLIHAACAQGSVLVVVPAARPKKSPTSPTDIRTRGPLNTRAVHTPDRPARPPGSLAHACLHHTHSSIQ